MQTITSTYHTGRGNYVTETVSICGTCDNCLEDEGPMLKCLNVPASGTAKVVVLGSPHRGKSCFISGLYSALGGSYPWIQVCPDGEGLVFHTMIVAGREHEAAKFKAAHKQVWSLEYAVSTAAMISGIASGALLDAGGLPSDWNMMICSHADYAVILYATDYELDMWRTFASRCGIKVLHAIQSTLDGDNTEHSISGLKRGVPAHAKPAIQHVASMIQR